MLNIFPHYAHMAGGPASLKLLRITDAVADAVVEAATQPFLDACAAGLPTWAQDMFRGAVGRAVGVAAGPPPGAHLGKVQYIPKWIVAIPDANLVTLPALTTLLAHSLFRCLLHNALLVAYGEDGKGDGSKAVWDLGTLACTALREVKAREPQVDTYYGYIELAALQAAALDVLLASTLAEDVANAAEEARIRGAAGPLVQEVNEVVNLKCPRCGQAFLDFSGCCALVCSRPDCLCGFCAYWCEAVHLMGIGCALDGYWLCT
jgi:hypothetical protein